MEHSPIIRFRINREIAEKAHRMAAERGMELPDVMRMMLTKAVRIGDFSIDQEREATPEQAGDRPFGTYEPRYWDPLKDALDAEAALALLHQSIADRTAWLDDNLEPKAPDVQQLERIRDERDEACRLLAAFDPKDRETVQSVFRKFGGLAPASTSMRSSLPPTEPSE